MCWAPRPAANAIRADRRDRARRDRSPATKAMIDAGRRKIAEKVSPDPKIISDGDRDRRQKRLHDRPGAGNTTGARAKNGKSVVSRRSPGWGQVTDCPGCAGLTPVGCRPTRPVRCWSRAGRWACRCRGRRTRPGTAPAPACGAAVPGVASAATTGAAAVAIKTPRRRRRRGESQFSNGHGRHGVRVVSAYRARVSGHMPRIIAAGLPQQALAVLSPGDEVTEHRVVLVGLVDPATSAAFRLHLGDLPPDPHLPCRRASTPDVARQLLLVVDPDGLDAEFVDQRGIGLAVPRRTASIHFRPARAGRGAPAAAMACADRRIAGMVKLSTASESNTRPASAGYCSADLSARAAAQRWIAGLSSGAPVSPVGAAGSQRGSGRRLSGRDHPGGFAHRPITWPTSQPTHPASWRAYSSRSVGSLILATIGTHRRSAATRPRRCQVDLGKRCADGEFEQRGCALATRSRSAPSPCRRPQVARIHSVGGDGDERLAGQILFSVKRFHRAAAPAASPSNT